MAEGILKPGKRIKPFLELDAAKKLVEKLYDVKIKKISELDSYDDRNYKVETVVAYKEFGNQFVFKITNTLDSSIPGLIESINQVSLLAKRATNFKVPCPIPDKNGELVSRVKLGTSDEENAVRLMTFVPGTIINQVEYTEELLTQVGRACGELTKGLADFESQVLAERQTIWSLKSLDKLEQFLEPIKDEKQLSLVKTVMKRFNDKVGSVIDTFPSSIIHGDINEHNIVVDEVNGETKFSGFLDFNDSHKAPTIFDLAILCAYLTLDSHTIEPMLAPKYIISGYKSVVNISEPEWSILPICMLARFVQSVTLGTYSHQCEPDNEYLISTAKKIWKILDVMMDQDEDELLQTWR